MAADDAEVHQNNINGSLPQGSTEIYDRLSSLHDSILYHILSFLPTRDVVRTGILSKRWKSLWIGVASFDISHSRCSSLTTFWNFVERVLVLRNKSIIKQFNLSVRSFLQSEYSHVQSILSSLVSHNVQHLDISLYVESQFTLPCCIFDCQYRSVLKLSIKKENSKKLTLELPDHIYLPRLKVLHLCFFAFPDAESIEKLLSCCPVLEELTLVDCKWIGPSNITISSPSIKRLTIGLKEDDNLVDDDNSRDIIIEAPALESFNYTGLSTNHFCSNKMSSAPFNSFIHITKDSSKSVEIALDNLVKFFRGLEENIVSLTISDHKTAERLLSLAGKNSINLPVLHRLKYLNLRTSLMSCDSKGLLLLFSLLPNLDTVEFSQEYDWLNSYTRYRWTLSNSLPNGFSSSRLKYLVLEKPSGDSYEFSLLNDFVQKAFSLQKVYICASKETFIDNKLRLVKFLEKLSTRFKHCTVMFSESSLVSKGSHQ